MLAHEHLQNMLGRKGKDVVTGFSGIVSSLSFDLYGCVQAVLTPEVDKEGKPKDGHWFDITRINITDKNPVMRLPDFAAGYVAEGKKGCAEKPASHRV